jgi:hypothetical protein
LGSAWFESTDGTEFVAHESFVDSDAVLAHAANVGDLTGQWVDLADGVDVQTFGSPSDEVRSALAAMAPTIFPPVSTRPSPFGRARPNADHAIPSGRGRSRPAVTW